MLKFVLTRHTTSTDCNNSNRIILLMISFIISWCKRFKTDPYREICTYATCVKPFLAKYAPSYVPDTALLENI